MASDNGKAGEIDWFDVWSVAEYIERKYRCTVEINFSSAFEGSGSRMLLCASVVGHGHTGRAGAAGSYVVPLEPRAMRRVPKMAYELLLGLQEEIDGQEDGLILLEPNFL